MSKAPSKLYNLDLERALIIYALDGVNALGDLSSEIKPKHFYGREYRTSYRKLLSGYNSKKTYKRAILESTLKSKDLPTTWLYESCSIWDNSEVKDVVSTIIDLWQKRKAYSILEEATADAETGKKPASEVLTDVFQRSGEIDSLKKSNSVIAISSDLRQEVELIKTGKRLKTGWDMLDLLTPKFIGGHMWIVGAHTATGKTWFSLQAIMNILKQGGNVALFSTEMRTHENLGRIIGNLTGAGYNSLWDIGDSALDTEQVLEYLAKIEGHLFIYDDRRTIGEISSEVRRLTAENKVDVVVIDFIQNVDTGDSDTYTAFRMVAQEVQNFTKDQRVCTIVTSQLSNSYARVGANNTTIEYKNAGELAAAADVGIVLFDAAEVYNNVMHGDESKLPKGWKPILCDIKKSRHTSGGKVPMLLEFPSGRVRVTEKKHNWLNKLNTISHSEQHTD